jgi:hypothetical protein
MTALSEEFHKLIYVGIIIRRWIVPLIMNNNIANIIVVLGNFIYI